MPQNPARSVGESYFQHLWLEPQNVKEHSTKRLKGRLCGISEFAWNTVDSRGYLVIEAIKENIEGYRRDVEGLRYVTVMIIKVIIRVMICNCSSFIFGMRGFGYLGTW